MPTLEAPPVDSQPAAVHPRGARTRVLLTSVFGPYARDDAYGSRAVNPMELYHNQVTRAQGVFSLRMFHRSWGLMLMQANVSAPCVVLDFPSLERFVDELRSVPYDVVGIGSILPNVGKVEKMCALVREHRPQARIAVGGHVANLPGLRERVGADWVVRGDGVRWLRALVGDDLDQPVRHPLIESGFGSRCLGVPLGEGPGHTAATLIPAVGCPLGCDFCSTSAMFGGKGRSVQFFGTAERLFDVMCSLERALAAQSFFVMDENFLLHRRRALRLLELMRAHDKAWSLYVFSSANSLAMYTPEELVALGIAWVWIGLEGAASHYAKLAHTDTRELVRALQAHGIRVLGSSIIGLPEHDPGNIDAAIEHAVAHDTDFHQFMLYTPLPGTPLHAAQAAAGTLLSADECPEADAHGQLRFNFRHARLPAGSETRLLLRAFERDFEVNGPSILRVARTLLCGFERYRDHPEARVRARVRRECRHLATTYAGALWAAAGFLRARPQTRARVRATRRAFERVFGWRARLAGPLVGALLWAAMHREQRRMRRGVPHEPPTFYDANPAALLLLERLERSARPCRWVEARADAPADAPRLPVVAPCGG